MVAMAVPYSGGMLVVLASVFVVPVLYCAIQEFKLRLGKKNGPIYKCPETIPQHHFFCVKMGVLYELNGWFGDGGINRIRQNMLVLTLIKMFRENPLEGLIALLALTVPLLISITIHEWAHGFTAYKFGDPTPKEQGRLSLNPLVHLDPAGTLALLIIGIGWAKPVHVNPRNIHGRFRQMMVAFAGPLSNFVLASTLLVAVYVIAKTNGNLLANPQAGLLTVVVISMSLVIRINLALGLLNLLPIPPLDGSNMVRQLLPEKQQKAYFSLARYSMPILLVLVFTGALDLLFSFADSIQHSAIVVLDTGFGGFFR